MIDERKFTQADMRRHWKHGNRVGQAVGFVYGVVASYILWAVVTYGLGWRP